MQLDKYFLPYQRRWLEDKSTIKIEEKSRRIGGTYVQAYEDVEDMAQKLYPAVWFSSADESAAKEYIIYCAKWAKLLDIAARELGTIIIDHERDVKALSIEFANGARINALTSNPKAFRSKGGKVVLDEFAWHDDQKGMWAAARPVITWGYPLRIRSTHNGMNSLFNKFIERIKSGDLNWSLHTTTIVDAVNQGIVDKILGRSTTEAERDQWLADLRSDCADETTWMQEYMCIPTDESSSFIPYDLYESCELLYKLSDTGTMSGELYAGMDVARKKHLSVIWISENVGSVLYTRKVIEMQNTPFHEQRRRLFEILSNPSIRRLCIDASGLGMQLAEEAQQQFGTSRVEAITFTQKIKEELAYPLRSRMEDRRFLVPIASEIKNDFHSVRKITTAAGNARFDVESGAESHADRFWAAALSVHAAGNTRSTIPKIDCSALLESASLLAGY